MTEIRPAAPEDKPFWFSLDRHLPEAEFAYKIQRQEAYLLLTDGRPAGLLRYQLFWDSIPFCTMLFVAESYRRCGYGKQLTEYWEAQMREKGHGMVLVSTRTDETAQDFYRKLGYRDCGCLCLPDLPGYAQPAELFLAKALA